MSQTAILFPAYLQVALTLVVLILLGRARGRSLRQSQLSINDPAVRLGKNAWSEEATKVANNFNNQFQLPVIFYVLIAAALLTKQVDTPMLALAWTFALSRIVHTVLHIGPNIVRWRGAAYIVGSLALLIMLIRLAWGTLAITT